MCGRLEGGGWPVCEKATVLAVLRVKTVLGSGVVCGVCVSTVFPESVISGASSRWSYKDGNRDCACSAS